MMILQVLICGIACVVSGIMYGIHLERYRNLPYTCGICGQKIEDFPTLIHGDLQEVLGKSMCMDCLHNTFYERWHEPDRVQENATTDEPPF